MPAAETTTFTNLYRDGHRLQYISAVAGPITSDDIPLPWREARVVHLGPLAQDLPADVACAFGGSLLGVTPQGWMRQWGADGLIHAVPWAHPEHVLECADVLVYSIDDVAGDERLIRHYGSLVKTMVVTQSTHGCTVYQPWQPPASLPGVCDARS